MPLEVEIKLRIGDPKPVRARLLAEGFALHRPRAFERNIVFDTAGSSLRDSGCLLRLREFHGKSTFTYKGPGIPGPHKSREEIETGVADGTALEEILVRLGYHPAFVYEKYRSEYRRPEETGIAMLDETPIGNFVELEGEPEWIDRTALLLGFATSSYITSSYGALFAEYRRDHPETGPDMVFPGNRPRD